MSDSIKHECGIAFIRLLKPLQFYREKYGTPLYGLKKLYLLMEKQHNRGQDGAGVATIKLNIAPGVPFIDRQRSNSSKPVQEIFEKINAQFYQNEIKVDFDNIEMLQQNFTFTGEVLMGHLRYGTFGKNDISNIHPFIRYNNWVTRNLVVAGNFNLTNVDELFTQLVELGQHPREVADTVTVLERIGHFLDRENQKLFDKFKLLGYNNQEISSQISKNLNIPEILKNATKKWDGGYAMMGMIGNGDAFVIRDPNGIRPCFYYHDDEIAVVTSERPAIQTAFNVQIEEVKELQPGNAIIIKKDGKISTEEILKPEEKSSCSFERIYFSRGTDKDIYLERKQLGQQLCEKVLQSVNYDIDNTVFSFIPNTAEVSFIGLTDEVARYLNKRKAEEIVNLNNKESVDQINEILNKDIRLEKMVVKDAKLRTFITNDKERDDLVAHVYDVTYGIVKKGVDNLVTIDDSIVRGTTLKQSILRILDRLGPKKIIIVSSAPQIRYPDCYGIDMALMGNLIAFEAAINLTLERGNQKLIDGIYKECKIIVNKPKEEAYNPVKKLYDQFTDDEISIKIAKLLRPNDLNAELDIIFQSVEGLHKACPNHKGDWYFTGNYPTPGGNKVVCRAFINYIEKRNERPY
jgi:amidophosphoribosyltransferase